MKREIIMFVNRISNTFKHKLLISCLISCVVSFLNPLKNYQRGMCNGYPLTMLLMFFITPLKPSMWQLRCDFLQFPSFSLPPFISLTLPPIYPFHPPPLITMSPPLLLLNDNSSPQSSSSSSFDTDYNLFFPTPFMSSLSSQKHKKGRKNLY
jgi:hypothetical protein